MAPSSRENNSEMLTSTLHVNDNLDHTRNVEVVSSVNLYEYVRETNTQLTNGLTEWLQYTLF